MMASPEPSKKPMLQHALEYLALGYPVFPICSPLMGMHQHRIDGRMRDCTPDKRGKNPMTRWKEFQTELPLADDVRDWWTRWPTANIGMATGALSGIIVLDCDNGEARQLALAEGGLEKAPAVWTGTPGGIHFWMKHPGYEVRNFVKDIPGTDFRGDGGYVLLPPSVHRNQNTQYRWNEHTIGMRAPPVPSWLEQRFQAKASGSASDSPSGDPLDVESVLSGFDEGNRDSGLFRLACRFRHDDQPQAYAEALIQVAAGNCRPPFDLAGAIEKVRRAYKEYEPGGVGPTVEADEFFAPPGGRVLVADLGDEEASPEAATASFLRPISELLAMPEVEPDWMVDQLFTVGSNGWVAAEPKVGKSWTVLELVYALSTGNPFLGRFAVKQPRRVIYIQEEDSIQRVLRRFKKLLKGDPTRQPPSDEYLRWSVRVGFKIDNQGWINRLRDELIVYPAEVVVLDVFNRLHGLEENKQSDMTALLNTLMDLNRIFGCAFIVVHHNRKPQAGSEARANQMIRGSGVLAGWGECSLYLRRSRDKDTIIVTPESKDAPEMDDFTIVLRDQDNGGIVLEMRQVEMMEKLSLGDKSALEAVDSLVGRGIGATAKAIAEAVGRDRSTTQTRLTKLVEAGYLMASAISDTLNATKIYTRTEAI